MDKVLSRLLPRPGFATIIRKNRGDWFTSVWNAGLCSGIHVFAGWTEMRSCIKIFHQKETNKKNKKKMLFLPAMIADGGQGFLQKKYNLKGGDFFPKTRRA